MFSWGGGVDGYTRLHVCPVGGDGGRAYEPCLLQLGEHFVGDGRVVARALHGDRAAVELYQEEEKKSNGDRHGKTWGVTSWGGGRGTGD